MNMLQLLAQESNTWCITREWLRLAEQSSVSGTMREMKSTPRLPRISGSIGVVEVQGPIMQKRNWMMDFFGGSSADEIGRAVATLQADPNIGAVLLDIHSPGGSSYGVFEAADKIASLSARNGGKPIIAIANAMAASAAFALMSAADVRYATPSGDVGSVGVYAMHVDQSALNEKVGVKVTYIAEPAAKVEGNPDTPLTPDVQAELQSWVGEAYSMFIDTLARNYGITGKSVRENFGGGRLLSAARAKEAGMIDGVATYDQVVSDLLAKAKPSKSGRMSASMRARMLGLKVKA